MCAILQKSMFYPVSVLSLAENNANIQGWNHMNEKKNIFQKVVGFLSEYVLVKKRKKKIKFVNF